MISATDIAKLREETGAGVMDCKKALEQAEGDFKKAKEILSQNADAIAKKKAERATNQGVVRAYVHHNNRFGAIVKIVCETDFVAKNADFLAFADAIAMQVASMNPQDVEELKKQPFIKNEKLTIDELLKEVIAKTGENIKIENISRLEIGQ